MDCHLFFSLSHQGPARKPEAYGAGGHYLHLIKWPERLSFVFVCYSRYNDSLCTPINPGYTTGHKWFDHRSYSIASIYGQIYGPTSDKAREKAATPHSSPLAYLISTPSPLFQALFCRLTLKPWIQISLYWQCIVQPRSMGNIRVLHS